MFGVSGVDRAGRPLAGAVVDRWLAGSRSGLGGGIALPFAMALLEYDIEPQRLALDVASGAVDLALEAALLVEPDRRAVAEAEARRLVGGAVERIDADRIARRELQELLGEARRPWVGTTLSEPDLDGALDEVVELVTAGFDLLRVEVPIGRELAARMHDAGVDLPSWAPTDRLDRSSTSGEPAPTGSQRALARLRRVADGVAAERRGYVRLATANPPLGVPEGAVVAAFERIDLVEADPFDEIVAGGVDPDRSLADHAFARRLHRRSDAMLSVGPGPLIVAPDLAAGVPSDPATRSGRALACQLIAVALARAEGIAPARLVVGAYPAWLADEVDATARIMAETAIRRVLFPDHPMRFDEPVTASRSATAAWPFILSLAVGRAGADSLIMRRSPTDARASARQARAAGDVADQAALGLGRAGLQGVAASHAHDTVAAALLTLDRLADQGWRAIVGDDPVTDRISALGADAVADRTESFDVLAGLDLEG